MLDEEVDAFVEQAEATLQDKQAELLEVFAQRTSPELRSDARAALAALRFGPKDGSAWPHLGEALRRDRAFVLEAVNCCPMVLGQLGEDFRGDREIVVAAVAARGAALQYASEKLRNDRSFASESAEVFRWCSEEVKADKEAVLAAVSSDHSSLLWAAEPLQSDREVVLAAVATSNSPKAIRRHGPYFLHRVSEDLLADKSFVIEVVKLNPSCLWHLPAKFGYTSDKEVVLEAAQKSVSVLRYADDKFSRDRDVVMATIRQAGEMLALASPELRADRELVMVAVASNQEEFGDALEFASDDLRNDKAIVLEATRACSRAFRYASSELRSDPDFALLLARQFVDRDKSEELVEGDLRKIYEGTTKNLRAAISKDQFFTAARCHLAQEGEVEAPTLTVSCGHRESGHSDDLASLVATTLGGSQIELPSLKPQATFETLAEALVRSRPVAMQAFKRVFLLFEDDPLCQVTPWNFDDILADRLSNRLG